MRWRTYVFLTKMHTIEFIATVPNHFIVFPLVSLRGTLGPSIIGLLGRVVLATWTLIAAVRRSLGSRIILGRNAFLCAICIHHLELVSFCRLSLPSRNKLWVLRFSFQKIFTALISMTKRIPVIFTLYVDKIHGTYLIWVSTLSSRQLAELPVREPGWLAGSLVKLQNNTNWLHKYNLQKN